MRKPAFCIYAKTKAQISCTVTAVYIAKGQYCYTAYDGINFRFFFLICTGKENQHNSNDFIYKQVSAFIPSSMQNG